MNEVEEFIKRRFGKYDVEECFCNQNCYWFAVILKQRFPYLEIMYDYAEGHFFCGDSVNGYDCRGRIDLPATAISLQEIIQTDDLWFSHLKRDCID